MSMILKGLTQKGKNRIRELGNEWEIVRETDSVGFSSEKGPWLLITPVTSYNVDHDRWIHGKQDKDFEILSK